MISRTAAGRIHNPRKKETRYAGKRAISHVLIGFLQRGRTCLHMAVFFNPDVDIINAVNTLYPQQALMKEKVLDRDALVHSSSQRLRYGQLGFTPLHLACISSKDANFLRAVAELEPEAALEQNRVNTCAGPRIP